MSGNDRALDGGGERDPDKAIEEEPSDEPGAPIRDHAASDLHQELSDLDQAASDEDQSVSDRDQARSDADQIASDRDQAAADRERALRTAGDPGLDRAYQESSADRLKSTRERAASASDRATTASDRATTAVARHENAIHRDYIARLRDLESEARDSAARERDRQAEAYEKAFGARPSEAALRVAAASDRGRAAADRAAAAADRSQAARDREWAEAEIAKAQLDDLTGVYRREVGLAVIRREIERARRDDGRLVLAFVDVDGLKAVNDRDGHAAGDALLTAATAAIRAEVGSHDPVVRMGGDEFVCAVGGADLESVSARFARIGRSFAESRKGRSITVGLAALRPEDSLETLLERGDADLLASRSPGS